MSGQKIVVSLMLCFAVGFVERRNCLETDQWNNILDELKTMKLELKQVKASVNALKTENTDLHLKNNELENENKKLEQNFDNLAVEMKTIKESLDICDPKKTHFVPSEGTVSSGHRIRNSKRELTPVAFTAVLAHNVVLGPHQAVEFDKIITNIGAAYDSRDGMFTAPIMGLYMFSTTICSEQNSAVHIEMVKNGAQLAAIYGDDYDLGSQTVMIQLNENDKVWVRHFIDAGLGYINNESDRHYTTFSGVLIQAL